MERLGLVAQRGELGPSEREVGAGFRAVDLRHGVDVQTLVDFAGEDLDAESVAADEFRWQCDGLLGGSADEFDVVRSDGVVPALEGGDDLSRGVLRQGEPRHVVAEACSVRGVVFVDGVGSERRLVVVERQWRILVHGEDHPAFVVVDAVLLRSALRVYVVIVRDLLVVGVALGVFPSELATG